ncbi:MAG: hypothetical protein ALECFALPRED_009549 [Alectoria fallacina]|uniref:Secreted protein n=1 Tax=Alectoria fallacina TaxID=1903189 RepID=A0A8H3J819_9LECA|nr:MAG: hypothetical protein ALECFALPRED_009549 [Alectoria fallacina]
MRSVYSILLFLAAAAPLLADEQSDCLAQASTTNGVIYWTGQEVSLDKADSYGGIMAGSNGTTKGCMQLGQWDGQIRIGDQPHPVKDSRTILETNPVGQWASYDVSYILGYSHAVVCQDTVQKTLTGDSTNLWNVSGATCEDKNGYTCVGPVGPWGVHASAMSETSCWNCNPPNSFFSPVAGAAYTYPDDNGSVIAASSNALVCCVGNNCKWKNPKAGTTKAGTCTCNSGADKRDATPESKPKKRHLHGHGIHKVRGLSEVI